MVRVKLGCGSYSFSDEWRDKILPATEVLLEGCERKGYMVEFPTPVGEPPKCDWYHQARSVEVVNG